jgi:uncharacterized membrane protein
VLAVGSGCVDYFNHRVEQDKRKIRFTAEGKNRLRPQAAADSRNPRCKTHTYPHTSPHTSIYTNASAMPVFEDAEPSKAPQTIEADFDKYIKYEKRERGKELGVWEQKIGTRWLLVAGIITVFVGVGYFLKFAYDNFSMGPQGRVIAVTIFGLIALLAGEITRRQGFGFVAKGVTALGFAILYAAVFSAYQIYHLIGYVPACSIASIITIGAMVYAVTLDEVLIAFLVCSAIRNACDGAAESSPPRAIVCLCFDSRCGRWFARIIVDGV